MATGATLAIQLLPYASDAQGEGAATPSVSVQASATGTPSASASPSGSASPGKSASPSAKKSGGGGQAAGAGSTGSQGGSGSSDGGKSSGSSGSSGSSSTGGSSSSGGSSTTEPSSSSTSYRIKNASNGQCLVVENTTGSYGVRFGDCTDSSAATWASRTVSGGTYRMVNEWTGQCMTLVPSGNPLASVSECGSESEQTWRTGSGGTLQNVSNSQCLEDSAGWPVTDTCTSGDTTQRWSKV
ncbi:RICIN domain-containing protein [Streptomyces sp. CA-249302]|uniref:RICIN domain-containing protein n=1 Tax=Streptomyces sp. CA-249302 TaxID=3240058 RepID=UPI003D8BF9B9